MAHPDAEQTFPAHDSDPLSSAKGTETGGFLVQGYARSVFVSATGRRCLSEMEARWREAALLALQIFADNAALWGTWGDDPRLAWRELCLELNGVAIYYHSQPEPFVVFHIAVRPDGGGGGGASSGFPSFFLPPPVGALHRAPARVHLMNDTASANHDAWLASRTDGDGTHSAAIAALTGGELRFIERALSSNERLWIDPDAIFPSLMASGQDGFGLDVLRRLVWTHDFPALKTALRQSPVLTAIEGARKCEAIGVPFGTDALQAWIEAAIMADWAPGRCWLTVEARARRKTARALAAFDGTYLVGADMFVGPQGAVRVDMKLLSAGRGESRQSAVVNASAWSAISWGDIPEASPVDVKRVRATHAARVIALARLS